MDVQQVRSAVIETLREIQSQSGRRIAPIGDNTRPIGDLEGFDSLNAEEAATMLCERLGVEIEDNPFITRSDARPLRVREIVVRLCRSSKESGGGKQ